MPHAKNMTIQELLKEIAVLEKATVKSMKNILDQRKLRLKYSLSEPHFTNKRVDIKANLHNYRFAAILDRSLEELSSPPPSPVNIDEVAFIPCQTPEKKKCSNVSPSRFSPQSVAGLHKNSFLSPIRKKVDAKESVSPYSKMAISN
ncbi:MAG: hypothetical protein P1U74_01055 [Legionellaceae bacterium]|nr:hypothetical protein [Legionellaceae bacterium]